MNGSKPLLTLSVNTLVMKIDMHLNHRFNIVTGFSGTGKSLLVDILRRANKTLDGTIQCNYEYRVLTAESFDLTVILKNVLLILDEDDIQLLPTLQEAYSEYAITHNQFYLLITREAPLFKKISYSIHAIYRMVQVSTNQFYLAKMYKFLDSQLYNVQSVITEGTGSIYTFSKELFNKLTLVYSANSKSEIVKGIANNNNVTALVDTAAFGCHAEDFANLNKVVKCSLFYNVESFEQLLLQFCKDYLADIHLDPLDYISLEAYFEAVMEQLPKECRFITKHKRPLAPCIRDDCDTCTKREHIDCKCAVPGDKFVYALKDTEFEYLLKYHKIKEATE